MVTRIGRRRPPRIFPKEWREHRNLRLEDVALRIGVQRNTIWRWENEPHRLDPGKMAALAEALDIEPEELWRMPPSRSIDAMLKNAPAELRETAIDIVSRLTKRAS